LSALRAAAGAPPEVARGGWPYGLVETPDEVRARPVAPRLLERLERQDLERARSSSSALGRRHATEQAPWQVGRVHVIAGSKGHPLHLPHVLRPRREQSACRAKAAARALLDSWICDCSLQRDCWSCLRDRRPGPTR